nr:phage tail assembly chaperone [uncultured Brevundimonas sp.]
MTGATPWGEMLRRAAGLGVAPEGFWRLSLKEWRMLTEAPRGAAPMGRQGLTRLMEAWPDGG